MANLTRRAFLQGFAALAASLALPLASGQVEQPKAIEPSSSKPKVIRVTATAHELPGIPGVIEIQTSLWLDRAIEDNQVLSTIESEKSQVADRYPTAYDHWQGSFCMKAKDAEHLNNPEFVDRTLRQMLATFANTFKGRVTDGWHDQLGIALCTAIATHPVLGSSFEAAA